MITGYQRRTVDAEQLFTTILRRELSLLGAQYDQVIQVLGQQDFDAVHRVPFVLVRCFNGQMIGPNAWEWDLFISLVAGSRDEAADIADMVYVILHESHDKNTKIPFVGGVTSVEDINMPNRTGTSIVAAGDLTQYDGSFRVSVRKI